MAIRFSVESKGVTRTYELRRSVVTFGRARECTVTIDDVALSRTHCQFEIEGAGCFVRDLNSRNGSFIDGERVLRVELQSGQQVQVGQALITFLGIEDTRGLTTAAPRAPTERWTARLFSRRGSQARASLPSDREDEVERLRRVLGINRRIASELEPERVLASILDAAVDLVDAERGFLVTVEKDRLFIPVARDFWQKDIPAPAFEVSRSVALEVVRRGISLITEDASEDPRFEEMVSVHDLKIRSVLCVPLIHEERVVGALYLDNRFTRGSFTAQDLQGVEIFAEQAAATLQRCGDFERVRERTIRWKEEASRNQNRVRDLEARLTQLERAGGLEHAYPAIVGRSPAMRACLHLVDRVTKTDLPVLLRGESGTGKELIARAIHTNGPRHTGPFVVADCGSFASGLIERELFGHVAGAFSGATEAAGGLLEAAHGGTLFLDEVGDMDPEQQKRLLRVLETGEIRRLGETRLRKVDLRVISATHRDLEARIASGEFREDLYYRLKGVEIETPPLRERLEDVPVLVEHFLSRRQVSPIVAPMAMKRLMSHAWPGNVRELENEIERLVMMGFERIDPQDLHPDLRQAPVPTVLEEGGLRAHVEAIERRIIEETLLAHDGNRTHTAEALGLSRLGLRKKMQRYGLE
ncbi:MAG: sigma 54-interacting transcriptional regulator [Planctomycetes bacterium]|nr:sigma 54-interacting transcriptional regulator [Planctomycetota bacterium]